MIPFQTTPAQLIELDKIVAEMRNQGLPINFLGHAQLVASTDQGVFDLIHMWMNTNDPNERDLIIEDIETLCILIGDEI